MTSVWAVDKGECSDNRIVALFSTEALAEAFVAQQKAAWEGAKEPYGEKHDITVYALDAVDLKQPLQWDVARQRGEDYAWLRAFWEKRSRPGVVERDEMGLRVVVECATQLGALKIASEKFREFIAEEGLR